MSSERARQGMSNSMSEASSGGGAIEAAAGNYSKVASETSAALTGLRQAVEALKKMRASAADAKADLDRAAQAFGRSSETYSGEVKATSHTASINARLYEGFLQQVQETDIPRLAGPSESFRTAISAFHIESLEALIEAVSGQLRPMHEAASDCNAVVQTCQGGITQGENYRGQL